VERRRRSDLGWTLIALLVASAATVPLSAATPSLEDFSGAVVVIPRDLAPRHQKAIQVLVEEVEKRSRVRLTTAHEWPEPSVPVVAVGPASRWAEFSGPWTAAEGDVGDLPEEGYLLRTGREGREAPAAWVVGQDSRGVLFGVGRLLREMRLSQDHVLVPDGLEIKTSPAYPLRGHELGYRPKTNSYDGFTPAMWEQYIRDLAVFGTNAVELIPPRSDDADQSPHFPLPKLEMMKRVSQILDDYDMDVWIWYPALDEDYSKPETVEFALREWGEVFEALPRIDAVYVPGGDPGHTPPRLLMQLLEKQRANLRRYHPDAQMWVAPEGFTVERMNVFYEIMNGRPDFLSGVVFGPWVRVPLATLREKIPPEYSIRRYPDITHSLSCQYPVPNWDLAYALTEGREGINPRPTDAAAIFRHQAEDAIGFISYSEGINDDVNKMVWSGLGWDPDIDVVEILRQYSRYFIGPAYEDDFAQGLLALERNWRGPLLANEAVETTLAQFQSMEREAFPRTLQNWRFQQGLYRAYYDAYVRARLIHETDLEQQARAWLRQAPALGSLRAIEEAESALKRADVDNPAPDWRRRIYQLAEALFQSIRMQLSVDLYQAISVGRGANLDTLDVPLNDRPWLTDRFAEIRAMESEAERLEALRTVTDWTDPGPGGYYDDLGSVGSQPHLVPGKDYSEDPMFFETPLVGFDCRRGWKKSWCDYVDNLYESSVSLRYRDLDPEADYAVRVVYGGAQGRDGSPIRVRLVADGDHEVHDWLVKPRPIAPVEFEVPREATEDGDLTLTCWAEPGRGGPGRGCQIGEVWLVKR
jgi:hypothetical protein